MVDPEYRHGDVMTHRAEIVGGGGLRVSPARDWWHEWHVPLSRSGMLSPPISVVLPPNAESVDLSGLLAQVHADALREHARQVTFDLRGTGPLGMAGLQHFVVWILKIQDLPDGERYTVHFIGDATDHWQKRGLQALRGCAENAISISFIEGNA